MVVIAKRMRPVIADAIVFANIISSLFASVFASVSKNIVVDRVGYYQEDVTGNCLPPDLGACKKLRPYMVV